MATWKKIVVESATGEIAQDTTGNSATVTTNANLTGHITSSGNAAVLGSFTVAQLSSALSDATISGNNTGDQTTITGNAGTATALASAQNFSITGDITASAVSFDGSGAVTLASSLAADTVGNAELDLVTGNTAANGNILSYSTDSGGDFKWIANTSAANDSTVTLAAGTGLIGGGSFTTNQSGGSTVTFAVDFGEFTDTAVTVADDYIVFLEGSGTGAERKESIADLVIAMTGTNLATQAGVIQLAANPDISGTLDVTGVATFDNNVIVAGDLTVNGTTTTVNSTVVEVADKMLKLANVASPTTTTANGGGIQLESSTTAAEWPEFKWNSSGTLAGWTVADHTTTSSTDFPISIMQFGTAPPSSTAIETEGGAGSFFADTTNGNLYLYI